MKLSSVSFFYHKSQSCSYRFNSIQYNLFCLFDISPKKSICKCKKCRFDHWVGKIPWKRKQQPTPVFLPGKSHGQKRLVGYGPWVYKELDTTELLSTHSFCLFLFLLGSRGKVGKYVCKFCPTREMSIMIFLG